MGERDAEARPRTGDDARPTKGEYPAPTKGGQEPPPPKGDEGPRPTKGDEGTRPTKVDPKRDCGCGCGPVTINIEARGDVHIYNCHAPGRPHGEGGEDGRPDDHCVPVSRRAKPKQSRQRKLDALLAGNPVPSVLAASFLQLSRRYLAGKAPANRLEEDAFDRLGTLSRDLRRVLECAVDQADSLPAQDRGRLFAGAVLGDVDTPVEPSALLTAFSHEIATRAAAVAFGDGGCGTAERPGQVRVFDPGTGEHFITQVRICKVNGLRTGQFRPQLQTADYVLDELEQRCVPVIVNGQQQLDCTVQTADCPGATTPDGTCLRVQNVEMGQAVALEGVNFFSVDATVRLTPRAGGATRTVDAHVCGDVDTPVTEVVDGETVLIADCRVHDRLLFVVPADLMPGLYDFDVVVPNTTGIANLGTFLASSPETIRILPRCSAPFRIESQRLIAHAETSPSWAGSDEVGIRIITTAILPDGRLSGLGTRSFRFDDVDSGESRDMTRLLHSNDQPIAGVILTILGHEVDSEDAYRNQIDGFTTLYLDLLKEQWPYFLAGVEPAIFALMLGGPVPALIALLVAAIAVAIALIVDIFIALWAPADLIIEDAIGLSACDLAMLTDANFAPPPKVSFTSPGGIKVKSETLTKGPLEYTERREYRSDDEDSRYSITFRYTTI